VAVGVSVGLEMRIGIDFPVMREGWLLLGDGIEMARGAR
jgi:hypothetical protein